jgi:hypothetical protein
MADVRATLVFILQPAGLRIAVESDETTDRARASARLARCESVAVEVVNGLPEVAREVADAEKAAAASDGSARFGGIGPIEEEDGFSAGIGIHTDERFEGTVWYRVDASGQLEVTTMGEDLRVPRAAVERVRKACAGAFVAVGPSADKSPDGGALRGDGG